MWSGGANVVFCVVNVVLVIVIVVICCCCDGVIHGELLRSWVVVAGCIVGVVLLSWLLWLW